MSKLDLLGTLLDENKKPEKKSSGLKTFLAIIGVFAIIAGIAYAIYRFFTPDYLHDPDPDFDDDFDDFVEEDEDGEEGADGAKEAGEEGTDATTEEENTADVKEEAGTATEDGEEEADGAKEDGEEGADAATEEENTADVKEEAGADEQAEA